MRTWMKRMKRMKQKKVRTHHNHLHTSTLCPSYSIYIAKPHLKACALAAAAKN